MTARALWLISRKYLFAERVIQPISPIDPQPIIEHGKSPTAIILAIAILISSVMGSITGLVRVIAIVFLHQAKS